MGVMDRPSGNDLPKAPGAREARNVALVVLALTVFAWIWAAAVREEDRWEGLFRGVLASAVLLVAAGKWWQARNREAGNRLRTDGEGLPWYLGLAWAVWVAAGLGLAVAVYMGPDAVSPLMYWFAFSGMLAYLDAKPRITARGEDRDPEERIGQEQGRLAGARQRVAGWWLERERAGFYAALAIGGWLAVLFPLALIHQGVGWWILPFAAVLAICLYAIFRKPPPGSGPAPDRTGGRADG